MLTYAKEPDDRVRPVPEDLGLRASDVCGLFRAADEPIVAEAFGEMLRALVD